MHLNGIVFGLDNNIEEIIVELEEPIEVVHCCYEAPTVLFHDSKKLILNCDSIKSTMESLDIVITKALQNQLPLHTSIQGNIGYLYTHYKFYSCNKEKVKPLGVVFEGNPESWVGGKHLLWAYDIAVWVYNDVDGSIVLEFTPWYFGKNYMYDDDDNGIDDEDYSEYEQFLKDYKSLFTRKISHETAQLWLDQANSILQQIEKNIVRLQEEGKF